jgi:hypothetical protein
VPGLHPTSARLAALQQQAAQVFEHGRCLARQLGLRLEIVDVEVLLDGQVILQCLGALNANPESFVRQLSRFHALDVRLEDLAVPALEPEGAGCGKPDCGREGQGGCSSCGDGGGCSSCGSSKVDMRDYFLHLRNRMEGQQRTPLL